MDNRFTKAIDEFFKRWMTNEATMIPLFNCHSGDEDGRCDDYTWTDWWETEDMWETDESELAQSKYEDHEEECRKDWEALTDDLWNTFCNALKANFDRTNCYWRRFYYITKDHKVKATINNRVRGLTADCLDELILDLDTYSEHAAEMASDNDKLESIDEHLTEINYLIDDIKYDETKTKVCEMLTNMVKSIQKSMPAQTLADVMQREG